jgi:hypothetical protein
MVLLAKLASGVGGTRTSRLRELGLITWTVTEKGHEWLKKWEKAKKLKK